jgi:hypothetical protein
MHHGIYVNQRISWTVLVVASLATVIAVGAWYRDHVALNQVHSQFLAGVLQPMATLIKDNQALLKELQAEPFAEKDSGILAAYLAKIRRDGVPRHADMKQRLDQLAENNSALVTLVKAYAPYARTPAFRSEADKFRNYASSWRDRWNSVMELFMAGGGFAAAGVPFPGDFPAAVDAEIAAAK